MSLFNCIANLVKVPDPRSVLEAALGKLDV